MAVKLKRIFSLMLVAVMLAGMSVVALAAYPDNYPNTHRNTGRNIADLIAVARTQIGYAELNPSTGVPLSETSQIAGYTKYGESFGYSTGEWCAYFVSWCGRKAGIPTSVLPRLGNCAASVSWYKKNSVYYPASSGYVPKAGDIVFFNWSGGSTAKHVGIVTGVSGNSVFTIEGNTGPGRGNRCMAKQRSRSAGYIVGYGVPAYNDSSSYGGSHSFVGVGTGGSYSDSISYSSSQLAVVTTSATEITATNAMLHGSVTNKGRLYVASAGFLFGTDKLKLDKYQVYKALTYPEIKLEMDVASNVGELKPKSTYYYRTYVTIDGVDYIGPTYALVTVDDIPKEIVLQDSTVHVGVGQTSEIFWSQLPLGSTDKGVTWVSEDKRIATVTGNGLVMGINYGRVKVSGKTNYGSATAECVIEVLIPTPSNLQFADVDEENITVKWDAVHGAKGYVLYRNSDIDSEPQKLAELDADKTEFRDTSVKAGEKYYYRIMTLADKDEYNSDISEVIYTTAKLPAPEKVTSSKNGVWINVEWSAVEKAKSYLVFRSTSENGLYTNIGKAYSEKFIDHDVLSGQTYYYKVVAENGNERTRSDFSAVTATKAKVVTKAEASKDSICMEVITPVPVKQKKAEIVRLGIKDFTPSF